MPLVCRNCGYSRPASVGDPGAACPVCKAPYPEDDLAAFATEHANRYGALAGAIVAVVLLAAGAGLWHLLFGGPETPPERPLRDRFSNAKYATWSDDYHDGIAQALSTYRIRGCGYFRYTPVPGEPGAFLVECRDQHDRKTGYRVEPDRPSVRGPVR